MMVARKAGRHARMLDDQGFTLLEMMVASGGLAVMALLFASLFTNSSKEQKKLELSMELAQTQTLLAATMNSDVSCGTALPAGTSLNTTNPVSVPQITFGGRTITVAAPGNKLGGWTLQNISLAPATFAQTITNGGVTRRLFLTRVDLRFVMTNTQLGTVPKTISSALRVVTPSNSLNIESCTGETDLMITSCTALGGTYTASATPGAPGTCEPTVPLQGTMKKIADAIGTKICNGMTSGYSSATEQCNWNGKTFAQFIKDLVPPAGSAYVASNCTATCNLTKTTYTGTITSGGVYNNRTGTTSPVVRTPCSVNMAALGACTVTLNHPAGAGSLVASPTTALSGTCTKGPGYTTVSGCPINYSESCAASCTATNPPQ